MSKALIIENDVKDAAHFKSALEAEGFFCEVISDGARGQSKLLSGAFDIAIVDIELGEITGTEILSKVRGFGNETPIIAVSGFGGVKGAVREIDAGADDYMPKPCDYDELRARVRALMRRTKGTVVQTELTCGDIVLDFNTHRGRRGDREFSLTAIEFAILWNLMLNKGIVVKSQTLQRQIWPRASPTSSTAPLQVRMHSLRQKLTFGGEPDPIENVRGCGYVIKEK